MATTPMSVEAYPHIQRTDEGVWATLCERCGQRLDGLTIGATISEHNEHVTLWHNSDEVPERRCPDCAGPMRLDRDPNNPLGGVLICNECQRVLPFWDLREGQAMLEPHTVGAVPVADGLWEAACACGYRSGHCSWKRTAENLATNHRLEHRRAALEDARYLAERPVYYDDDPSLGRSDNRRTP